MNFPVKKTSHVKAPPKAKVYSYERLSSKEQLAGDGRRRQGEGARKWAESNGVEFDEQLSDLGVSAFTGDNVRTGALAVFLERVKRGEVARGSKLVLESLDRMSRQQLRAGVRLLLDLLDAGIDVVTLGEGGYVFRAEATGMEQMVELMLAIVTLMRGHEESSTKSRRVGEAWATKRKRAEQSGEVLTELTPAWIQVLGEDEGRYYDLIPERAALVKWMFEQTAAGVGRRTIARILNGRNEPTWGKGRKKGEAWHASYIGKILDNRAVLGECQLYTKPKGGTRTPVGDPIPTYYPRAVTQRLWDKAQHRRGKMVGTGGGKEQNFSNLLRNLCYCGECGGTMALENKGERSSGPKLTCVRQQRWRQRVQVNELRAAKGKPQLPTCTHNGRYKYINLEAAVLFGLQERAKELLGKESEVRAELQEQVDLLKEKVANLAIRRDRLINAIENGATEAMARLSKIRADMADAERELDAKTIELRGAPPPEDTPEGLAKLHAALRNHNTNEQRRDLNLRLRRLIKRIDFHPQKKGGATVVIEFMAGDKTKWFAQQGA